VLRPLIYAGAAGLFSAIRTTPLGIMLLAGFAFYQHSILPAYLVAAMPAISFLTLAFSLAITACFNRGRAFFIVLILLLSQWGIAGFAPAHVGKEFALHGLHAFLSLLLPFNLLFFASIAERGIFSLWGRKCLTLILIQAAMVLGMVWSGDKEFFNEISKKSVQLPFMSQTPIPDIAVIAFLIVGVLLLINRRRATSHFRLAIFCVVVVVALAHHFYRVPFAIPLFYAAAGLIIILSVMQDYYFKAYRDELTNLPSRRSLNEAMMQLDGVYVIAMLDVDFFKKFNDTYGHDAGDDVLRLLASVMKEFKGGTSFRYGGEEFTILFPGKGLAEAIPRLDELRKEIAKRKFVVRGSGKTGERKLTITVSIGAAESTPTLASYDDVIKAADQALYRAKENGRNCVSE
jgi:diguanylate cyclase (GGDEF)-like protein